MYLHGPVRFSSAIGTTHRYPDPFVGWYIASLVKSPLSEEDQINDNCILNIGLVLFVICSLDKCKLFIYYTYINDNLNIMVSQNKCSDIQKDTHIRAEIHIWMVPDMLLQTIHHCQKPQTQDVGTHAKKIQHSHCGRLAQSSAPVALLAECHSKIYTNHSLKNLAQEHAKGTKMYHITHLYWFGSQICNPCVYQLRF